MPFQSVGNIRFYQFEQLGKGLPHGIFTRRGGVSPEPWAELNLGGTVGDDLERVRENRRRALASLNRHQDSVFEVWQVHGVEVAIGDAPRSQESPLSQADVILTDKPSVTLMMRFADCVPILFNDPVRKVVGIAHAGWMGTVRGTVRCAVETMKKRYNSKAANILAAIGPSIGPDHYEIGPDVVNQIKRAFGGDSKRLLSMSFGSMKFDLWAANRLLLEQAGVHHIEVAGLCTACDVEDWYSHRAEKGRTGRFGAIIALA
jgi:YfiH family protein